MAGTSGFFELVAYTALHAADVFAAVDTTDSTQSPVGSTKKITAASVFAAAQPITIAAGTVTVSTPVFQATETWNASGVTFTAINLSVTDTASASGSLLLNLSVGGLSKWKVDKAGNVTAAGSVTCTTITGTLSTAAQPNVTSVGTLTGLTVSGSSSLQAVTATSVTSSGNIALSTNSTTGIQGKTSGGATVNVFRVNGGDITRFISAVDASGFQWTNQAENTAWMSLIGGALTVASGLTVSAGGITVQAGKTTPAASGAGGAGFNLASGAAPTSPSDGDMWYDGTNVKFRVGGTTKTFTLT